MKNLIIKYVSNLTKDDIRNFCKKENITIYDGEVNLIYNSIKKDTDILLSSDSLNYIKSYKNDLNEELYNKIIELYNKYKSFIN